MTLSGRFKSWSQSTIRPRGLSYASPQSASSTHSSDHSSVEPAPSIDSPADLLICDESQLSPIESQDPDLRELNNSLVALAAIFPDVRVEVFREMLSSLGAESRLAVVTEALLTNRAGDRYRVAVKEKTQAQPEQGKAIFADSQGLVNPEEKFRSAEYRKASKAILCHEFKGLFRSTINAVLAEFNHSYTLTRPTLITLSSKSWAFSISSLFLRRKSTPSLEAEHHPLVIWQSTGQGSIIPTFKRTSSPELDKELFDTLIVPIKRRMCAEREEKDHTLALELNNREAEANEGLHDCKCCFTATTFEDISTCDDDGHFICFQCVRHAVNEAVFGQGWQRNINANTGTLRCIASMYDYCNGCIPYDFVRRAFNEDKSGNEVLRKLDERLTEDNLLKTKLPLIRCPFCSYAEVDELYLPESQRSWRLKRIGRPSLWIPVALISGVGMIPFLLPVILLLSSLFLVVSSRQTFGDFAISSFHAAIIRLRRKRRGLKFICQNKSCCRASCISCSKGWTDIHICNESSLLALRTQVELAMSLAIKRTCPRCNTSFVKSSGCNKLTCVCGYQMCYVCRKDIGNGEGYGHFCDHFRLIGGRGCKECSKCDLYRCEDDEVVVKKAKEEAERRWMEKHGSSLGGDEKKGKQLEEKRKKGDGSWWEGNGREWKIPNWEQLFDAMIEIAIE